MRVRVVLEKKVVEELKGMREVVVIKVRIEIQICHNI